MLLYVNKLWRKYSSRAYGGNLVPREAQDLKVPDSLIEGGAGITPLAI
jgi:hypothetical protein